MAPILTLEKISKRFGAIVVANGIDLSLAPGEALGIIGPNGAGKTTLFGIISGTRRHDGVREPGRGRGVRGQSTSRLEEIGMCSGFSRWRISFSENRNPLFRDM